MVELIQASSVLPADTCSKSSIRAVDRPTSSSELPDSLASSSAFVYFINGADRTMAKTVYDVSKVLPDVIDKVGHAVPPLKAVPYLKCRLEWLAGKEVLSAPSSFVAA